MVTIQKRVEVADRKEKCPGGLGTEERPRFEVKQHPRSALGLERVQWNKVAMWRCGGVLDGADVTKFDFFALLIMYGW
jgi:hypothetical protein